MLEVEISIPPTAVLSKMESAVEAASAAEGLELRLKGKLAKYPGCVHWHFQKGREPGTLEITWWAKQRRLWFKVAIGRRGQWMEATIPRLKSVFEKRRPTRHLNQ